jgi:glycosyltransferase involved in cell wall biosynthesis
MEKKEEQLSSILWQTLTKDTEKYPAGLYPKVSIVIPTLNCSQSISGTIESVLQQDYPHLEIIIIDASSIDRTVEVIQSYHDPKIRFYSVATYHR